MVGTARCKHKIKRAGRVIANHRFTITDAMTGVLARFARRNDVPLVVALDWGEGHAFHTLVAAVVDGRSVALKSRLTLQTDCLYYRSWVSRLASNGVVANDTFSQGRSRVLAARGGGWSCRAAQTGRRQGREERPVGTHEAGGQELRDRPDVRRGEEADPD